MPKRRNYVDEILDKKTRSLKNAGRWGQFQKRAEPLAQALLDVKSMGPKTQSRRELLKYFPIAYISCLEGYFRLLIADLIDAGPPYSQNAARFEDLKFPAEAFLAVGQRVITPGELIAHVLPLSSVCEISRVMSTVLGEDFLSLLKGVLIDSTSQRTVADALPTMIPQVEEAFRLRHIFAHELAPKERPTISRISKTEVMVLVFVVLTEELVGPLATGPRR